MKFGRGSCDMKGIGLNWGFWLPGGRSREGQVNLLYLSVGDEEPIHVGMRGAFGPPSQICRRSLI